MDFQTKLTSHCVFQSHIAQYGYETYANVKPAMQNHITKNINFKLKLSLINDKAPNLYPVNCSEMNKHNTTVK